MNLHRIGVKFFVADPSAFHVLDCVPIFHRWIKEHLVEDHLLIDVAEYDHVWQGPRVVLVAFEGNLALDEEGGRLGLYYYRKQPLEGELPARLRAVMKIAVRLCAQLENEDSLQGKLEFRTDECLLSANDRLAAPNTAAGFDALQAAASDALGGIFGNNGLALIHGDDPKAPLRITARTSEPVGLNVLADRLA